MLIFMVKHSLNHGDNTRISPRSAYTPTSNRKTMTRMVEAGTCMVAGLSKNRREFGEISRAHPSLQVTCSLTHTNGLFKASPLPTEATSLRNPTHHAPATAPTSA